MKLPATLILTVVGTQAPIFYKSIFTNDLDSIIANLLYYKSILLFISYINFS